MLLFRFGAEVKVSCLHSWFAKSFKFQLKSQSYELLVFSEPLAVRSERVLCYRGLHFRVLCDKYVNPAERV